MRVLGEEAVQDPTAIEQQVRDQMAERQQAHDDRNEARKLTPAERREKKHAQLVGELGADTLVAVYRVRHRPAPPRLAAPRPAQPRPGRTIGVPRDVACVSQARTRSNFEYEL